VVEGLYVYVFGDVEKVMGTDEDVLVVEKVVVKN